MPRRRTLLALVVLTGALTACALPAAPPERAASPDLDGSIPVPADAQDAVVVRVVDGDTLVLRGRGAGPLPGEPSRVRVLLIDTPEVGPEQECFGAEAAARTSALLPAGAQVRVQGDLDPQDRFDRSLLHVWTAGGVNLGELLLAEGHATVLQIDPNRRYLEQFSQREQQARADRAGLWSACR